MKRSDYLAGIMLASCLSLVAQTPPAIVERMNAEVNRALALPDIRSKSDHFAFIFVFQPLDHY